jgi:anaerobic selenocysteine-containing dehydrogenase
MFCSPTAHLADYILPITNHLESDAIAEYSGLNIISARVRIQEPRGEAREEAEVVLDVAKRLGVIDKFPADSYRGLLDYRVAPLGIDFDKTGGNRLLCARGQP